MTVNQWAAKGACRSTDPDVLFVQGAAQNRAKAVCLGCPVRTECLADALDHKIEFGVWGGMTERERRALLRRRPNVASWRQLLETARIQQIRLIDLLGEPSALGTGTDGPTGFGPRMRGSAAVLERKAPIQKTELTPLPLPSEDVTRVEEPAHAPAGHDSFNKMMARGRFVAALRSLATDAPACERLDRLAPTVSPGLAAGPDDEGDLL